MEKVGEREEKWPKNVTFVGASLIHLVTGLCIYGTSFMCAWRYFIVKSGCTSPDKEVERHEGMRGWIGIVDLAILNPKLVDNCIIHDHVCRYH